MPEIPAWRQVFRAIIFFEKFFAKKFVLLKNVFKFAAFLQHLSPGADVAGAGI
ncbi:MAG: hypothetical protein II852_04935 [Bacteroidales bacterium]|nr:hypothetical protein [Bacteroidales bacterium]